MEKIICPVCHNTNTKKKFKKNVFNVQECSRCALIFISNPPIDTSVIYDKSYFWGGSINGGYVNYEQEKSAMRAVFEDYLVRIGKHTQVGDLLDVGAATGFFLKIAKNVGWRVAGVEISKEATAEALRSGLEMHNGSLESSPFQKDRFNCITMFDLIEHITNPHTIIQKTKELLKKDGVLVINTPNIGSLYAKVLGKNWHLLCPPEHLILFNKKSITYLLNEYGFEVLYFGNIGKTFTVQYIIHQLIHWIPALKNIFRFIPIEKTPIGKIPIPLNFHDNMFLIAKKK